jgi:hypothetical protein
MSFYFVINGDIIKKQIGFSDLQRVKSLLTYLTPRHHFPPKMPKYFPTSRICDFNIKKNNNCFNKKLGRPQTFCPKNHEKYTIFAKKKSLKTYYFLPAMRARATLAPSGRQ